MLAVGKVESRQSNHDCGELAQNSGRRMAAAATVAYCYWLLGAMVG